MGKSMLRKYLAKSNQPKPKYPGCLMAFAVLSDIHMMGEKGNLDAKLRSRRLKKALEDVKTLTYVDAVLSAGDTTDGGEEKQWQNVERIFSEAQLPQKAIFCMGNHDARTANTAPNPETEKAQSLYKKYYGNISGQEREKIYSQEEVKGYPIFSLSTGGREVVAYFDEEQLVALEKAVERSDEKKPFFLLSHFAFNKTHGLPKTFGDKLYTEMTGGLGIESDRIFEILNRRENVYLMSGHSHMGLNKLTYQQVGKIHSLNLPCFQFPNHDGVKAWGYGYVYEVYADKVVIRARNFLHSFWDGEYSLETYLKNR